MLLIRVEQTAVEHNIMISHAALQHKQISRTSRFQAQTDLNRVYQVPQLK